MDVDTDAILEVARYTLNQTGVSPLAELSILLVDTAYMTDLNHRWMGGDGPTDVLAFPLDEASFDHGPGDNGGEPTLLGDIVLCPEVAGRQAASAGHSPADEVALLTVHGTLHLLGYDHAEPEEEREMFGLQDRLLTSWRLARTARLPAPRIDLAGGAGDRAVPLLAATMVAETSYRVHTFDTTVEQGIPCVWALAANPDPADGRPALICAAGAHPDPARAARAALAELAPGIGYLTGRYAAAGEAERARAMVADPELVRTMADHSLLYADPQAAARLDFLTGSPAVRPLDRVGRADRGGFASDDLSEQLREAVRRYTAHDLDVIVVDQTVPEHRAGGLHCVKVLIPGTLPMTFGHAYRRVDGLPRLHRVPQRLGYRRDPLPPAAVNPHPHPFP